jgi:hypothetical protein
LDIKFHFVIDYGAVRQKKMFGLGKRKKIPSSQLQDAAALVVVKPRRGKPQKVTNTTTENGIFYIFLFMLILLVLNQFFVY